MLTYAVIIFAIAALGGLVLANSVLRGQLAPWGVSLAHAGLGALGLILVLLPVLNGARGAALWALVILLIAALAGFYLASLHLKKQVAPRNLVVIHAGVAVIGFLILANAVFAIV